jgi:ElaB/YqjD/DUF883 family membrane-anchored ribosome-binding protein
MITSEHNQDGTDGTDDLRADLEQTRERVSSDIEALGNKLSPDNLKAEAKQVVSRGLQQGREAARETLREGTERVRQRAETAKSSVAHYVRENPVPLSLIGLGVGLLIWNSRQKARRGTAPDPAVVGRSTVYEGFDGDYAASSRGRQHQVRERVREGVESVRHAASETAHSARERWGQLEHQVTEQAQRAKVTAANTFEEQPLALGAVALGAGIAIGLSIPATESENQLVGHYRDRLFGSLKQQAARLESAAERTLETAQAGGE